MDRASPRVCIVDGRRGVAVLDGALGAVRVVIRGVVVATESGSCVVVV